MTAPAATAAALEYVDVVEDILRAATRAARPAIAQAGALLAERFDEDGLAYVFGSGHSHVFAEEAFYRAGGSARICPVLQPDYMLHVSAQHSTVLEREPGHAREILAPYDVDPRRDAMIVVSNSGANALPVEMATHARDLGMPVVAITSVEYARASRAAGRRLHEIADVVLDNRCPPGDALVAVDDSLPRVGPGSSVVGLALLNAVVVDALARQVAAGIPPDVYLSAGMPGAAEHNARLARRFAARIPHI